MCQVKYPMLVLATTFILHMFSNDAKIILASYIITVIIYNSNTSQKYINKQIYKYSVSNWLLSVPQRKIDL